MKWITQSDCIWSTDLTENTSACNAPPLPSQKACSAVWLDDTLRNSELKRSRKSVLIRGQIAFISKRHRIATPIAETRCDMKDHRCHAKHPNAKTVVNNNNVSGSSCSNSSCSCCCRPTSMTRFETMTSSEMPLLELLSPCHPPRRGVKSSGRKKIAHCIWFARIQQWLVSARGSLHGHSKKKTVKNDNDVAIVVVVVTARRLYHAWWTR